MSETNAAGVLKERPWASALLLGALCTSECIPQAFIGPYLLAWLIAQGVPDGQAANVVGLIALPFGFKVLWAPFVDAYRHSSMGRRRPWILLGQLGMVGGGVAMACIETPERSFVALTATGMFVMLFMALQDVATDGLVFDLVTPDRPGAKGQSQDFLNAAMVVGQLLGRVLGTALLPAFVLLLGFRGGCWLMSALFVALFFAPLMSSEPPADRRLPFQRRRGLSGPDPLQRWLPKLRALSTTLLSPASLIATLSGFGLRTIFALAITLDASVVERQLGWTATEYSTGWGVTSLIAALLAALVAARLEIGRVQLAAGAAGLFALALLVFGAGYSLWPHRAFIYLIWAIVGASGGAGMVAFYAIIQRLSSTVAAATQLAFYTSVANLGQAVGNLIAPGLRGALKGAPQAYIAAGIVTAALAALMRHIQLPSPSDAA